MEANGPSSRSEVRIPTLRTGDPAIDLWTDDRGLLPRVHSKRKTESKEGTALPLFRWAS